MKAFLLAAGLGLRLRPITENLPKPLVRVGGVPLILYPLSLLQRAGIREIGINLHYLPEMIPDFLGDGRALGLSIRYFREERLLGTGGALRNAASFLSGSPFVLMNADTLLELDLDALLREHRRNRGIATLAISPEAELSRFGGFSFDRAQRIQGLLKPGEKTPQGFQAGVYAGAAVLDPEILSDLETGGPAPCLIRQGILPAIARGREAFAFSSRGFFADLGTLESYREVDDRAIRGELAGELFTGARTLLERLGRSNSRGQS